MEASSPDVSSLDQASTGMLSRIDAMALSIEQHDSQWLRRVKLLKFMIQALIAVAMVSVLFLKVTFRCIDLSSFSVHRWQHLSSTLLTMPTLTIVGRSLAYSAGIELAYMLFTPGPDEAIDPVIVGLAASILIYISDEKLDLADFLVVPITCLAIGFLLYLKRRFKSELGAVNN